MQRLKAMKVCRTQQKELKKEGDEDFEVENQNQKYEVTPLNLKQINEHSIETDSFKTSIFLSSSHSSISKDEDPLSSSVKSKSS